MQDEGRSRRWRAFGSVSIARAEKGSCEIAWIERLLVLLYTESFVGFRGCAMSWRASAVSLLVVGFINVSRAATPYTAGNSFQAEVFTGQGGFNEDGPPSVYVSAMLERLLVVDDKQYRFESVTYVHLSWRDPNAKAAITEATERFRNSSTAECKRPCTSDWTLSKRKDQSLDDSRVLCCDEPLWLPTIAMMNVYSLPDTRLQPYQIVADKEGGVSWAVTINGEFFSPMNVQYFPFDSQALKMEFAYVNADYIRAFVPSAGSTRFGQRGEGDVVSGWNVEATEVVVGNTTVLKAFGDFSCCKGEVGFPALDDPAPIGEVSPASFDGVRHFVREGLTAPSLDSSSFVF